MQYLGKVSIALGICSQLILAGCSEDAEFTSSSKRQKKSSDDAVAQASGATTNDVSPKADTRAPEPELTKIEKTFQTTFEDQASIKFMPKLGVMQQEFTLVSTYENLDKNFSQNIRQNISKTYTQGTPGEAKTDNLKQSDQGILDLLIVVDNSGSMKDEQQKVSTKLAEILEYVKDSDWRIGIVTTDPANGCSRKRINKGDANAAVAFAEGINAGLAGSGNERGILQAVRGLSCEGVDFVRANSTIAVLIVSDEDNCSNNGGDCKNEAWNKPEYLTDFLKNAPMNRKLGSDARVYGLFWDPAKTCPGAAVKAVQYAKAVADTQGTSGSICDADYTSTLLKISQDVATILKADFKLSSTPDASSIVVKVNGDVAAASTYTVMGDVLRFNVLPPKGAAIQVTYTVGAVPMTARYGLGETPAANTVKVQVNGNIVSSNEYTIDNASKEIVFKTMPVANAKIKIDFLKNTPLLKDFELGPNVKTASVSVKVNNVVTAAFSVNSAGKVSFTNAPEDGAVIAVNFDKLVGPVLEYTLPLAGAVFRDVQAFDKDSNAAVLVSVKEGSKVIVESASHKEGATVVLLYKNEDSNKLEVNLPYLPLMDSINVESGDVVCALGMGVELVDMKLKIDCDWASENESTVTFKYKKTPLSHFVVPELAKFKNFRMKVLIEDEEITDFTVIGVLVSIDEVVPSDSTVKIIAEGI